MAMNVKLQTSERWTAWNKPPGIPVFPPHANPAGDCLLRRTELDSGDFPPGFAGGLAHRLDTPTSGQVLSAQTPEDLVWLRHLFASGALTKVYRFVSDGSVSWNDNCISAPIAHDKRKRSKMIVQRGKNTPHRGKWLAAETSFRRLGPTVDGGHLWEAVIHTGVMHQIRVHAAFVGLALRGDGRYGGGPACSERIPFLLHHLGLSGPGIEPLTAPLPAAWPL
jgi:23S rRNA-/tRNA-specific pseudouridylate synthase